jgi:hypothetical protein
MMLTVPAWFVGLIIHPAGMSYVSTVWFVGAIWMVPPLLGGVPPLIYLFPRKRASVRRP